MTKLRQSFLAGAVIAAFACGGALAQLLTTYTLTGLETWQVGLGGPGGTSQFVTTGQMRNSQGIQLTSLASGALTIPNTISDLVSTVVVSSGLAVTAPASPWDGEIFEYVNASSGANTATVTFTANTGQTVQSGAVATLAQNGSAEWRYAVSTLTWYRLR